MKYLKYDNLEKQYFELLLKFCLKVDKSLFISSDVIAKDATERFVEYAKNEGVKDVYVCWSDAINEAKLLKNIKFEDIKTHKAFDSSIWNEYALKNAAFILFRSEIPGVFDGVEERKIVEASRVRRESCKIYKQRQLSYEISWNIAVLPNEIWAKTLFSADDCYDKFYYSIFDMCMVSEKNDTLARWKNQLQKNTQLALKLNSLQIKELHYTAPNGTDLKVKLTPNAIWLGADKGGIVVNMPTYEVFTFPDANGVDGVVKSTRPLYYNGVKIDNFSLNFKDGKVIDFKAEKGEQALECLLKIDEGCKRLGEVALVNCNSPVANQNKVFCNTLLDENASCHFALGNAYPTTCKNYQNVKENAKENGFNISNIHEDFMVGYNQLKITAQTNQGEVLIMENGLIVL